MTPVLTAVTTKKDTGKSDNSTQLDRTMLHITTVETLIMSNWLDTANEMHRRHCDTQIEIAEKKRQETVAKAISDSIEAVADVAKEMVKNGESKEARMLMNETIKNMGESPKRLNSGQ